MTERDATGRILTERDAIGRLMAIGVPAEDIAEAHEIPVASVLLMDLIFRRKREVRARMAGLPPKLRTYRKATGAIYPVPLSEIECKPRSARNWIADRLLNWSSRFVETALWIAPEMEGFIDPTDGDPDWRAPGAPQDFKDLPF